MASLASLHERSALEAEMPFSARPGVRTVYEALERTAARHPDRQALVFQLRAAPNSRADIRSWSGLRADVARAANLFRSLGAGPERPVAVLMPNCGETAVALLAAMTAGMVLPISPLLAPEHIAAILRESGARVLVTLAPMPGADLAPRAARALRDAPSVETVVTIDLKPHLPAPLRLLMPFLRPRRPDFGKRRVLDFAQACLRQPERLEFDEPGGDPVCACFHTGGTTGLPKLARHRQSGILYNGWCARALLFRPEDTVMCPLPLFHVFAAYPVLIGCVMSGARLMLPTPQGYRGKGVFDRFWKLVERWEVTLLITVPTAVAALMQRPVDADVSSLKLVICGSAPLPPELCRRFESACGLTVLEGYGMTEATCLVACNPVEGPHRPGSVGLPFPYSRVSIRRFPEEGEEQVCGPDEIGEICLQAPGVLPADIAGPGHKVPHCADGALRTGDLGRIDAEGYLWITGRAKDMIIRGGHNIDPASIEEALMSHPSVGMAAAIGQPDAYAGELPCVYVEPVAGHAPDPEELRAHARAQLGERAAVPRHVEVLPELPRTAVGKIYKPALRARAISRVLEQALAAEGLPAQVVQVREDVRRGLLAEIALTPREGAADAAAHDRVHAVLGGYPVAWELSGAGGSDPGPEKAGAGRP